MTRALVVVLFAVALAGCGSADPCAGLERPTSEQMVAANQGQDVSVEFEDGTTCRVEYSQWVEVAS